MNERGMGHRETESARIIDLRDRRKASKRFILKRLRAHIQTLEMVDSGTGSGASPSAGHIAALPFGVPEVDSALPWGGLPAACVHEVIADGAAAGEGFCAVLLARLGTLHRPALWCLTRRDLYPPGLGVFGLQPDHLIIVRSRRAEDVPWAMEEALRSGCVGAVLGELPSLDLTAGRRLQLAARRGGVTCLVLRGNALRLNGGRLPEGRLIGRRENPSPAVTRWRVAAAPSQPNGGERWDEVRGACWRVELVRCRGAIPRRWLMEWNDETNCFALASLLAERTPDPAPAAIRTG